MGFVYLPEPRSVGLPLLIPPALTLNSVGTRSFGVARPRNVSRPQPNRMARTEEKSLSTLRTWPHVELSQISACHPLPSTPFPIFTLSPSPRIGLSHRRKGDTHHRGEEVTCLYMLEGGSKEEGGKEEQKGEEGNVWDCVTARATRLASLSGALKWRKQRCIDQA